MKIGLSPSTVVGHYYVVHLDLEVYGEGWCSGGRLKQREEGRRNNFLFSINSIKTMKIKKRFSTEEAKKIGEALNVDWSKFDVEQFRIGMDVELEHGLQDLATNVTNDNSLMTGKIALAHLNEFPDYYTRLKKMEAEAEEFYKSKKH